jgi:hypothetical protein
MTISERRAAALDKCNEVCHREYMKYLEATQDARNEYAATLKQIDDEADGALSEREAGC